MHVLKKKQHELHTRDEAIERLKMLYERGYRYVARDKESFWIDCFSAKPKRFLKISFWGYKDKDLANEETLAAYPIFNLDMTEINWNQRNAMLIKDVIDAHEKSPHWG